MATAIKALRTSIAAATSNAAGATTTGTAFNLTTALGGVVTGLITNGATGPTVGADFVVQVSGDNTNWKDFTRQTAGIANNGVYPFEVELPPAVMYARILVTGNTGQAITCEAFIQELSSVG